MNDTSSPTHRADKPVRTHPRIQPIGKHVGEYEPEDRLHQRLGADGYEWDWTEILRPFSVDARAFGRTV